MIYNSTGRKAGSLLGPVALLSSSAATGLWLTFARDGGQMLLSAALLALTASLGTVWLVRARAVRRLNAAVEAYAERELARAQRRRVARAI